MKTERLVIALALVLGLLAWVMDAVLDYFIFYQGKGTLADLLLARGFPHEFYIRCVILALFLGFGLVVSTAMAKRRRTEESLRESEERFRSLFENAPLGYQSLNVRGDFLEVNEAWCKTLDYTKEEVLGRNFSEFIHPDFREHFKENFPKFKSMGYILGVEFEMIKKDGTEIIVAFDGRIGHAPDGSFKQTHCVLRDITQQKQAQEALRESEEKLRSLYFSMNEGLCLHEVIYDEAGKPADYRILDVNPAYESILGVRREDAVGALASEFYGTGEPPYLDRFAAVAETGEAVSFETYFPPLEQHFAISAFRPGPGQFATVFTDVTERRRAEEEREKLIDQLEAQNTELERFTYTVSHDLKSPLITIKGYLGLLREDMTDGDVQSVEDDITRMLNAADRMEQLLEDLLELSRIGRLVNPSEDVALGELAQEAVELVAGQIEKRGVKVRISPDLPVVYGDRPRLLEVLQNLIDNGVKYMGDQPRPQIDVGVRCQDGETVCFVRDNGAGIDPRYRERIFGLFDQLNQKVEGSGIGLALVKRIVEVHGGRIWVESAGKGQGSTFCFTIPPERKERTEDHEPVTDDRASEIRCP